MAEFRDETGIYHIQYPASDEADFDYRVTGILDTGVYKCSVFFEFRNSEECYVAVDSTDAPPQKSNYPSERWKKIHDLLQDQSEQAKNVKEKLNYNPDSDGDSPEMPQESVEKLVSQYISETLICPDSFKSSVKPR